jgi:hypothetical protein
MSLKPFSKQKAEDQQQAKDQTNDQATDQNDQGTDKGEDQGADQDNDQGADQGSDNGEDQEADKNSNEEGDQAKDPETSQIDDEIIDLARETFLHNKVGEIHITSDRVAFLAKSDAYTHARDLEDKNILSVKRESLI